MATKKTVSFEQAESRILQIVQQLEEPGVSIDKSIELFTEGAKLVDLANGILDSAKLKIEEILPINDQGEDV